MSAIAKFAVVVGILAVALSGALVVREVVAGDDDPIVIVHWANGHPMTEPLMPAMAEAFNEADHETASGRPIRIELVRCDSADQANDLVERIESTPSAGDVCEADDGSPAAAPTIVTPQSTDWLLDINYRTGQDVVDIEATQNIAETWLGIVTYREMAICLGWPDRQIGYADILALRADPDGWRSHDDCAKPSWGITPKLAFTNPRTSTSGRNVLVSLFSIAAGKEPEDLTLTDIERPEVLEQVRAINSLLSHYQPTTTSLNTRIAQGPSGGHFFLLPEDNLVGLRRGDARAIADDGTAQRLTSVGDLVMIHPKEGSVLNANPAGLVRAAWVTPDHVDGAEQWIAYLRRDDQQETFMSNGFRSSTGLEPDAEQFRSWGLDPTEPATQLSPGDLDPDVLERIIELWGSVKNPAVVTFVLDVSTSMEGEKLAAVKQGMTKLVEEMADASNPTRDSQVGLITFDSKVREVVLPTSIGESKWDIQDVVDRAEAGGGTALFTALSRAITMTDGAEAADDATRAVVVLSDGEATEGTCLSEILEVWSSNEVFVPDYCGMEGEQPFDEHGSRVSGSDLQGRKLARDTTHDIQVFFVGFGDADVNIGRLLADATGAEFQGSTEEDLANVIEGLSGYF